MDMSLFFLEILGDTDDLSDIFLVLVRCLDWLLGLNFDEFSCGLDFLFLYSDSSSFSNSLILFCFFG